MYNVVIVGSKRTGKSSLRAQWLGHSFSQSYTSTLVVEKSEIGDIVLWETPVSRSFDFPLVTSCYRRGDIFVLVTNSTIVNTKWYDIVHEYNPTARWMVVTNGPVGHWREWVDLMGAQLVSVQLATGTGVSDSFKCLRELCCQVGPRQDTSLSEHVYWMLPCT